VLVELGLVEQRHKAVLEVLGGATVTDVALRYGVTRQTVHAWLRRYGRSGLGGLADHSSRPGRCPHQIRPEIEARIVDLRRSHPLWGPRTIRHQLSREGVDLLPGRSSIYRCLIRHHLVDPTKRKRRREDYRRWERSRSMELWQMDIMGGVKLEGGRELKIITGIDDHSRFCVSALLVYRATARPVCEALALALRRYGVPDQILSDNGKVFTSRFGPGKGEMLFDRICRENGVRHLLTAPSSPTTTGKVERFHKTIRREFLSGRIFASIEEAQSELDAWINFCNTERPHQGIGMVSPATRFSLAQGGVIQPVLPEEQEAEELIDPKEAHGRRVLRTVSDHGRISLLGFQYHVGRFLAGETAEVEIGDDGLLGVFHRGVLVATHARRHLPDKEPASWQVRPRVKVVREKAPMITVTRKVDPTGSVSFAGTGYRVGNSYRGKSVEVALVADTVQIKLAGKILRTHQARHDKQKELGAFANPGGRPIRRKAS
jgi:transposase InsO family protein